MMAEKKNFSSVIHVLCVVHLYQIIQPVRYTFMDHHNHIYYLLSRTLSSLLAIFKDVIQYYKKVLEAISCQSQWPRGPRRRSLAVRLLRLWVRIPRGTWMSVCCVLCVVR